MNRPRTWSSSGRPSRSPSHLVWESSLAPSSVWFCGTDEMSTMTPRATTSGGKGATLSMNHDHQADEIRKAMAEVRRDVDANSEQVFNHAREMADWRYHVRKYPKLSLAAAAAIGYLLVPAKRRPRRWGKTPPLDCVGSGKVETARQASLTEQLLSTAARLVIRNGLPLVAREAIRLWQQRGGSPSDTDSSSSLETQSSSHHS